MAHDLHLQGVACKLKLPAQKCKVQSLTNGECFLQMWHTSITPKKCTVMENDSFSTDKLDLSPTADCDWMTGCMLSPLTCCSCMSLVLKYTCIWQLCYCSGSYICQLVPWLYVQMPVGSQSKMLSQEMLWEVKAETGHIGVYKYKAGTSWAWVRALDLNSLMIADAQPHGLGEGP